MAVLVESWSNHQTIFKYEEQNTAITQIKHFLKNPLLKNKFKIRSYLDNLWILAKKQDIWKVLNDSRYINFEHLFHDDVTFLKINSKEILIYYIICNDDSYVYYNNDHGMCYNHCRCYSISNMIVIRHEHFELKNNRLDITYPEDMMPNRHIKSLIVKDGFVHSISSYKHKIYKIDTDDLIDFYFDLPNKKEIYFANVKTQNIYFQGENFSDLGLNTVVSDDCLKFLEYMDVDLHHDFEYIHVSPTNQILYDNNNKDKILKYRNHFMTRHQRNDKTNIITITSIDHPLSIKYTMYEGYGKNVSYLWKNKMIAFVVFDGKRKYYAKPKDMSDEAYTVVRDIIQYDSYKYRKMSYQIVCNYTSDIFSLPVITLSSSLPAITLSSADQDHHEMRYSDVDQNHFKELSPDTKIVSDTLIVSDAFEVNDISDGLSSNLNDDLSTINITYCPNDVLEYTNKKTGQMSMNNYHESNIKIIFKDHKIVFNDGDHKLLVLFVKNQETEMVTYGYKAGKYNYSDLNKNSTEEDFNKHDDTPDEELDVLITLRLFNDSKVFSRESKNRTDHCLIESIVDKFGNEYVSANGKYRFDFVYHVGEEIRVINFDNSNTVCTPGIHFCLSVDELLNYGWFCESWKNKEQRTSTKISRIRKKID